MIRKEMVLMLILILLFAIPAIVSAAVNSDPIAVAMISPVSVFACENTMVKLDASFSSDKNGWIVKYEWLYGEDEDKRVLASGKNIVLDLSRKFDDLVGTYPIILRVTDNGGATDNIEIDFSIKNNPRPQIEKMSWERGDDDNDDDRDWPTEGEQILVEVTLVDPASGNYGKITYDWAYDHEVFFLHSQKIERDGIVARFEVIEIGWKTSYKIGVVVSNACGERDEKENEVEIKVRSSQFNSPPEAQILLPIVIKEDESFYPESRSTTGQEGNEGGDGIVDWYWKVEKVENEKGKIIATSPREYPRFRIDNSGRYTIFLEVTDCFGEKGSISNDFDVKEAESDSPITNASATNKTAIFGEPFELNGSYSLNLDLGPDSDEEIKYSWWDETYGEKLCCTKNPTCEVIFNRSGEHTIKLEAWKSDLSSSDEDDWHLSSSDIIEITVIELPAPTVSPAPTITSTPTPTPTLKSIPTPPTIPMPTEKIPPPPEKPKSLFWETWEIIENFIGALLNKF